MHSLLDFSISLKSESHEYFLQMIEDLIITEEEIWTMMRMFQHYLQGYFKDATYSLELLP
jgi:hypothetical protein